ncbi:MAG TPA: hypothetical protein PKC43_10850 [Phycisphaerales bacterium]|nr:hypothetical protein [Phycisphaerales bacterium]HMP37932.1 hypothetical protein [Phycisphaerales bacterium]
MTSFALFTDVAAVAVALSSAVAPPAPPSQEALDAAIARGTEIILAMQETGDPPLRVAVGGSDGEGAVVEASEWPYEGVYRVRGQIPVGYRIGGTSICALALLEAPGYAEDARRHEAIARATRFVCAALDHPLMNPKYDGGYDVRGWGHCYALHLLLALSRHGAVPEGMEEEVARRTTELIAALEATEIPEIGGWSYSRPQGWVPSPVSPFMTAPVLQALMAAKRQGHAVDDGVVERALDALERCRTPSGSWAYAADGRSPPRRDATPGATGRMLSGESVLLAAGRGSIPQVRGALDAFIAHWERLEERRAQTGTHLPPFGVAPYYFYFAHWHAAQAIGQLPPGERPEYARRTLELLFRTRDEEGRWNDRVFPRSAAYGTACAILSILATQAATTAADLAAPAAAPAAAPQRGRRRGGGDPMPVPVPSPGSGPDAAPDSAPESASLQAPVQAPTERPTQPNAISVRRPGAPIAPACGMRHSRWAASDSRIAS